MAKTEKLFPFFLSIFKPFIDLQINLISNQILISE
jgi:hypothetical protein